MTSKPFAGKPSISNGHKDFLRPWTSALASEVASKIASRYGVYCGPAAVVWIAAVWNAQKNRPYDYIGRIQNKKLFPDGPRAFQWDIPGFKLNLNDLLLRETNNDLRLSDKTYFGYSEIHDQLHKNSMPMIIRIPSLSIKDGLHYVTLYESEKKGNRIKFYWQDNGVFKSEEKLPAGLSVSTRRNVPLNFFLWGARQVQTN